MEEKISHPARASVKPALPSCPVKRVDSCQLRRHAADAPSSGRRLCRVCRTGYRGRRPNGTSYFPPPGGTILCESPAVRLRGRKAGVVSSVEPRFAIDKVVQFRVPGDTEWRFGRTRNLSRSGLLFSCNAHLEVGALVEIRLLDGDGDPHQRVSGPRCVGRVVRRDLMSWPEVVPQFAVQFLNEDCAVRSRTAT